uniref:Uncharacterized protein n=1 Tax=Oryza rufipogon TaxID=4529 RepID=A0A0E0NZ61_ORYRU
METPKSFSRSSFPLRCLIRAAPPGQEGMRSRTAGSESGVAASADSPKQLLFPAVEEELAALSFCVEVYLDMRRRMLLPSSGCAPARAARSLAAAARSHPPLDATPPEPEPEPDGVCDSMSRGSGDELDDMICSSPDRTWEPSRVVTGNAIGIVAATVTAPVVVVVGVGGVTFHRCISQSSRRSPRRKRRWRTPTCPGQYSQIPV